MAQLLGITIEDTTIKLLLVDGKRVKTAAKLPLQPGLVKDGVVLDKAAVSQVIRQLLELLEVEKGFTGKIIASVSGIHSVYRLISLPRLPGRLLNKAVRREAERVMPVPLGELYLSWQAIPASDAETLVCLVSLPKDTVDTVIDTLRQAQLEPSIIDVRPLAIARAAGETQAIAINVEVTDFDIVITINGIPELVRSLAFSQKNLLPGDKAVETKEELDRTIRFYNTSHEATPIAQDIPVILGGDTEIVGLLSQELPYPIKPLAIPLSYPEDLNISDFMTNIGLVLKEVKPTRTSMRLNLNTIPEVYLPKPIPVFPIFSWISVIAAFSLLVWLGLSTHQAITETSRLQAQLSQARTEIRTLHLDPKQIAELETKLKAITTTRDGIKTTLVNLEQQRAKVSEDLNKATSLLPANITLTNISHGTVLSVKGTAPDENSILSYAKSLKESGRFSQVMVSFDTRTYQKIDFTLTLK